jgi:hypothetical protein
MNDFSLKMEVHLAMPIRDIMNVNQYQQNNHLSPQITEHKKTPQHFELEI